MNLPLAFRFHPHFHEDRPGDVPLAVLGLVGRAPCHVAIHEPVGDGPDEGVVSVGDEGEGGRPAHSVRRAAGSVKLIIADSAVGVGVAMASAES